MCETLSGEGERGRVDTRRLICAKNIILDGAESTERCRQISNNNSRGRGAAEDGEELAQVEKKEASKSKVATTVGGVVATTVGVVVAASAFVGLAAWSIGCLLSDSGEKKDQIKTMAPPGKKGHPRIIRKKFEDNPAGYFRGIRKK